MKKMFMTLTVAIFLVLAGKADILLWTVSDEALVDGTSTVYQWLAPMPYDGDPDYNDVYGARIAMKSASGELLGYLSTAYQTNPDETNPMYFTYAFDPDVVEVDIGHPNAKVVGSSWNQSETGVRTIGTIQEQINGTAPVYPESVLESMFVMEIGHSTWDESVGDYVWETLAQSAPELYSHAVGNYMYATGDIAPLTASPWTPTQFYTVPEPSIPMLMLLGAGMLAFKRRA